MDGKDRKGNKYPAKFNVKVPRCNTDTGSVIRDKNGNIQFVEEFGKLTCWHIAHRDRWNEELCAKSNKKLAAVSESKEEIEDEEDSEEEIEMTRKTKKRKSNEESSNKQQKKKRKSRRNTM